MKISVIIPARNAEGTIQEAIHSLQAQLHADWEAIVIDDGSTDKTAEIVGVCASVDPRITLLRVKAGGVSAARNRGIEASTADWILFLDADDWIKPAHLQKMTTRLKADTSLDGVYCGYSRMTEDGTELEVAIWWDHDNLFYDLARNCLWAIHACIVRKSIILEVGGFIPGWQTCEDWDLWLRIVRTGARFGAVRESLAIYRVRRRSASMNGADMARGSIALVNLGHGPDPRVPNPKPEYADGAPPERAPAARLTALAWPAGLTMGQGEDACALLDLVPTECAPGLDPYELAASLFESMILPSSLPRTAWIDLWPDQSERIARFLSALERQSGAVKLTARTMRQLEQLILSHLPPRRSITIGTIRSITLEATSPLLDIRSDREVERIVCNVLLGGNSIGKIFLPLCDGFLAAEVLADAIASEFTWHLLDPYMERTMFKSPGRCRTPIVQFGRKAVRAAGRMMKGKRKEFESWALASMQWVALVRELFTPDAAGRGMSVEAPSGRIALEISHPIPTVSLRTPILEVVVHMGGVPFGVVDVAATANCATPRQIRRAVIDACGFELCRLTVREAVVGRSMSDWLPPGELLARNAEKAGWTIGRWDGTNLSTPEWDKGTVVLGLRWGDAIGTSASRRASLPAGAADEIIACAGSSGEPIEMPEEGGSPIDRIVYSPATIGSAVNGTERAGRRLPRTSRSRRGLDIVSRLAERSFPLLRRKAGNRAVADRLPVLMYHRIAVDGPRELASYRVGPAEFEEQLRYMKSMGYYSVSLEEWHAAKERRKQIRGRPVLLTFDDGYVDFLEEAFPLLEKYGFGALVFLVAGRIGRSNSWDSKYGETNRLMTWEQICALQEKGIEFGSHTVTHPPLTALSPEEIVREGALSRAILQKGLGRQVKSFAYPFGDFDPVVSHLIGACGYIYGFTCYSDVSRYHDSLLAMPRINVEGGATVEWLAHKMEFRYGEVRG